MSSEGGEGLAWLVKLFHDRARRELAAPTGEEGLRERKKRITRQLISDTATALFLERGFHEVRVAEVAKAAGVSEKTVFNYFPTKEALVLDREEGVTAQIRHALAQGSPVAATVRTVAADVRELFATLEDRHEVAEAFNRFMAMLDGTPELRAAQRDMEERLVQVAAETLAARVGVDPLDPEPQIAALALVGLWRISFQATRRQLQHPRQPHQMAEAVVGEVRRAGRLIDSGLWSFGALVEDAAEGEELRASYESVEEAVRQVVAAVRQARAAWRRRSR